MLTISADRKLKVYQDLCQGSDPRRSFFLLVAVSTLIAAFGLVMNSTAVVIGAMLVAPLMTPILGLGLALVRGDPHLIRIATRAEFIGVIISVASGLILGLTLPEHIEPTSEMLSRTHPNLFDLLVAVLAGAAGAYALVDEKLSPVLPGVAISTAIVPPLANCGLYLAMGSFSGAQGSFLLFFTNFLSILLVSALVFYFAGMADELRAKSGVTLVRRFGVAVLGFIMVSIFLSDRLLTMFEEQRLKRDVWVAINQEFADLRISEMSKLSVRRNREQLVVRADVFAPAVVGPRAVSALEQQVAEATGYATALFVRTTVTQDVSATRSTRLTPEQILDGAVHQTIFGGKVELLSDASQLIREYLENLLGMRLENLTVLPFGEVQVLHAEISGVRQLGIEEIRQLEVHLEQELGSRGTLRLLVQSKVSLLADSQGQYHSDFEQPGITSSQDFDLIKRWSEHARQWLAKHGFWMSGWSATLLDGTFYLLLEVRSHRILEEALRAELVSELKKMDSPQASLQVYVRSQLDTVVGPGGNQDLDEILGEFRRRNRAAYSEQIENTIKFTR